LSSSTRSKIFAIVLWPFPTKRKEEAQGLPLHLGGSVGAIGLWDKASLGGGESNPCTARFLMLSIAWCVFEVMWCVVFCVLCSALEVYHLQYRMVWFDIVLQNA